MAYIEIKVGNYISRIEDTDTKFNNIINTFMSDKIKSSSDSVKQLDLFIDYLVGYIIKEAKASSSSKLRREFETTVEVAAKSFDIERKVK